MGRPPALTVSPHGADRWWLVGTAAGLAAARVIREIWVPQGAHFAFNLGLAVVIAASGALAGLTEREVGLERAAVPGGLRWGGVAYLAVAVPTAAALALAGSSSLFEHDRADVSGGELALSVLVRIPFGTVVVEELAFRGVLLALSRRLMSTRSAIIANSVLFGVWHLPHVWDDPIGELAGVVVATGIAGLVFCWLRVRSASLLAPALAHLATNTVPLTAAWLAIH